MPELNLNLTICNSCHWNSNVGCIKGYRILENGWCSGNGHTSFKEGRDIKSMNEEILKYRQCKNGSCE